MKKFLILLLALTIIMSLGDKSFAVFTPPEETEVSQEEIKYAESVWKQIRWETSRVSQFDAIFLTLPEVKPPFAWSVEKDTGTFPGLKVEWVTAYSGPGQKEIPLDLTGLTSTGFYLNLVNVDTAATVAAETYIYYSGLGLIRIPPEACLRGAVDNHGRITGYYDLWGRPVVTDFVYQSMFASKYVSFSDLKNNHWAYHPVYQLTAAGYFRGYRDGTFKPDSHITRAEFMVIMSQLLNNKYHNPPQSDHTWVFQYFNSTHWAYEKADKLLEHMSQEDTLTIFGNEFGPDRRITREEVAAIIHAALKEHPNLNYRFLRNISFPDTTNSKFTDSVSFCANYAIVSGYPDGTFKPGKNMTRAEVAAILVRVYNLL